MSILGVVMGILSMIMLYYNCIGTVSFLTAVYASVQDGEAVRRVCVRKEAAHAEYP